MRLLCRAFGLSIESDLEIPGALPGGAGRTPEMHVRLDSKADPSETIHGTRYGPYYLSPEGLYFEQRTIAQFHCNLDATELTVRPYASASAEDLSTYLIATALPAMLWLRGEPVLHAAAFLLPGEDGAIALMGASGSGKSTMLAALINAGCTVVAEDSLCVREHAGDAWVSGLPGCLWLHCSDAGDAGQRCMVPVQQVREKARLRAVLWLGAGPVAESLTACLRPVEALDALLQNRHRPTVPTLLASHSKLLPQWAALARRTPVYHWSRKQMTPVVLLSSIRDLLDKSVESKGGQLAGSCLATT